MTKKMSTLDFNLTAKVSANLPFINDFINSHSIAR